ncbi:MAG: exodeoxyribonuclease III [Phycisphaeraceae bacterium]|nr:exodeoxyribonuclease III [Phycisphaerales bacterium]MCB9860488.1 exodeoxyribonuclease III [Phycisphaeraceae bacterium]
MRITTWNVNGLRAAVRKGVAAQIARINPDVLLLQEVRAMPDQLTDNWHENGLDSWSFAWNPAEKPGYAGTALFSRDKHKEVKIGVESSAGDPEGRLVIARVGPVRVASVYLPSGSSGDHRQIEKEKWMKKFAPWAEALRKSRIPTILGGDFNIARTELDIFHAKSNEKSSGFLPHERAWMDTLVGSGWADIIRERAGEVHGPYTWWSNRGRARELDRGWRIDYVLANPAAAKIVRDAHVDRDASLTISDHAPVSVDLDI